MTARVQEQARVCESCEKPFGRRTLSSGRLEQLGRFEKRRFCSRECYRIGCADGLRLVPPGAYTDQPHPLHGAGGASDGGGPGRAGSSGYPWDRQRAPSPTAIPGHFSAERQTNFPEPRRETP